MKDTRLHYTKDPILFDLSADVFRTGLTMCDKRREIPRITASPSLVTCVKCLRAALAYYMEQVATCQSLIEYAETGQLRGTSAEAESSDLIPRIHTALDYAKAAVSILNGRLA